MYVLSPESTSQPIIKPIANITQMVLVIFFFVWSLLGLIAFIYSLYCFGKSGTVLDKTVGFIVALLTGPFFFLYLYVNRKYCK